MKREVAMRVWRRFNAQAFRSAELFGNGQLNPLPDIPTPS
jgi:hypothetical protein